MFTISIELQDEIKTSLGKESAIWTTIPLKDIPANVLKQALLNGFIGALNDISRGKDDNGKALSDDAWQRKREARVKAWLAGEWTSSSRSESNTAILKDQYIAEQVAEGMTVKAAERNIKELVQQTFGEKEPATFARFLDAVATHLSKEKGAQPLEAIREEIEASLMARAEAAASERAKATEKVDVKGIALAAFRK